MAHMQDAPTLKPGSPQCPKCSVHVSYNPSGLCGYYHSSNTCPLRSPPERRSDRKVCGVEVTCGELVEYHRTGEVPDTVIRRAHEVHT